MHDFELKPHLQEILKKLYKKDKIAYEAIMKKIDEIVNSNNIDHYKNLRGNMKDRKRVHVASSFILVFSYDPNKDLVSFTDYDHHDKIYI